MLMAYQMISVYQLCIIQEPSRVWYPSGNPLPVHDRRRTPSHDVIMPGLFLHLARSPICPYFTARSVSHRLHAVHDHLRPVDLKSTMGMHLFRRHSGLGFLSSADRQKMEQALLVGIAAEQGKGRAGRIPGIWAYFPLGQM